MAYYEKRGEAWRAQIRRKGYPTLSATFDTKAEAQRWAAGIEGDMSRSRYVDQREAERTSLAEALKRYRAEVSDHKKGAKQEAARIARWLEHPLADKSLAEITSSQLAGYRDERIALGASGATVRLDLAIISHLYTVASKEWNMDGLNNPVHNLRLPSTSKSRDRRPTTAELEKLYAAAADIHPELPVIIALAADTAMRRSELVLLRREQVKGKVAYLEDTKNGQRRAVPLSTRALALIKGLPARLDGRLFSLKPDSVSNYFALARDAAGIEDLRLHDMRHEATSRLFEMGLPVMEAAAVTGHKTLSQLARYTHLRPEDIADKLG
ncbi:MULTISPECIES: integrase [Pseudomonas]|uniref:integrase n=1 Tax=Pseudomonas TaxID=286 RepID=UPI00085496C9|nr:MULTISPECIES: site-specific integrase [Pseudomonas]MBQ53517.1 site-specific integrase [Pseudomonadaceae bacterium]OEO24024.1 integrase [Pseudomonas sp. J237]HCP54549.1 site-specific integrase [Pseudomonas sp.]